MNKNRSTYGLSAGDAITSIIQADKGKQLFFGFIFVGLLVKIILGVVTPATALIWGYFIIIFSIIGLVFLQVDPEKNNFDAINQLFQPLLLLIIILLWNISLTFRFYKEINHKTVPKQYFMWSGFSTILIISIIIFSILSYLLKDNNSFTIYSYVLLIFNLIVTAIQQVILDSFTVDG
jgi:hypothetical protein